MDSLPLDQGGKGAGAPAVDKKTAQKNYDIDNISCLEKYGPTGHARPARFFACHTKNPALPF
jgi:hypothetical protein